MRSPASRSHVPVPRLQPRHRRADDAPRRAHPGGRRHHSRAHDHAGVHVRPVHAQRWTVSRATRGTCTTRSVDRPQALAHRSQPERQPSPAVQTSADRSASRRRSTVSSTSSRPTDASRGGAVRPRHLCRDGPLAAHGCRLRVVRERPRRPDRDEHTSLRRARDPSTLEGIEGLRIGYTVDFEARRSTQRCATTPRRGTRAARRGCIMKTTSGLTVRC